MRFTAAQRDRVRQRWQTWLSALAYPDLADILRSDPDERDTAPRSAVRDWLKGKRTPSAASVFEVGQRLGEIVEARQARTKGTAAVMPPPDGIVALHAAGYGVEAARCLAALIDDALERYPKRAADLGVINQHHEAVRALEYALTAAAGLPVAHAHLDNIQDRLIPSSLRGAVRERIAAYSSSEACVLAWVYRENARLQERSVVAKPTEPKDLGESEILYWATFVDSISVRALSDSRIALQWREKRKWFDGYRNALFGNEPMTATNE